MNKNKGSEIKNAVDSFYTALNDMLSTGNLTPMFDIWSHADDTFYMGPVGGTQKGWKEIKKVWEDQAKMNLGFNVIPSDIHTVIGSDIAFTQNYENAEGPNKTPEDRVKIRATNIFRKENGQWKMISHHTDTF
ncbi:SnoaL-like domain-containing protein [bacterium]|jgi:ketosteroid isomerase-like protein|nr:SnoaL-like domain-containing protein [bacterium]